MKVFVLGGWGMTLDKRTEVRGWLKERNSGKIQWAQVRDEHRTMVRPYVTIHDDEVAVEFKLTYCDFIRQTLDEPPGDFTLN